MSEYYSNKQAATTVTLIDIDGNQTVTIFGAVAKKVSADSDQFYLRIDSMAPIHKDRFDKKNQLINPTFIKVDSEIFNQYLNYLSSSKEGFYSQVRSLLKLRGLI